MLVPKINGPLSDALQDNYVRKFMHACHSVSVLCRPAETRRRCSEIGSVYKSILVGQILPSGRYYGTA